MSKSQITDILILGIISGIVALLTSILGVSGTIIGSVLSSIIAEVLKRYLKDPVTDKISEYEKTQENKPEYNTYNIYEPENIKTSYTKTSTPTVQDNSHISSRILFIFPLVVILIIEVIHFLGKVNLMPNDIFYSLESITNWTLLRTIGYALVVMGFYPLIAKSLDSKNGILLIIVGIIELIFGYADVNSNASMLYSLFSSLSDYINIAIILTILYTILTIPEDTKKQENTSTNTKFNTKFHTQTKYQKQKNNYPNNNYKFKKQHHKRPPQPPKQDSIDEYMDDNDYYF